MPILRHCCGRNIIQLTLSYFWKGVVGVAQDVTEAAHRDRAVSAMANELRQLVDTANAPIFGIDVKGNVNEWNDKTAEITGYSKDEAFNKPLGMYIYNSTISISKLSYAN